jgi:Fe-S cluster biogenesis protein NfuA
MASADDLPDRLEALLAEIEELDEEARAKVFELLDGIDTLHRSALRRLEEALGEEEVGRLRSSDAALAWLFDAYGIGVDEAGAAEAALESIRPYIHSHGGRVDVLGARDGVIRLRLAGACSGCTASAITLKEGIEQALEDGLPGFRGVEVEEDEAESHPPPGPTLLQIGRFERR